MSEENSQSSAAPAPAQTTAPQASATEAAPAAGAPADAGATAAADSTGAAPADSGAAADTGSLLDGQEEGGADESGDPEGKQTEPKLPDTLGAPESYDYKDVKLEDGVSLGEGAVKAFNAVAKELDLSQKTASAIMGKVAPAIVRDQMEQVQALRSKWAGEARSDPSIDWARSGAAIKQAYKALTTPAVRDIFKRTGLDCNPDVIRIFKTFADRISQDSFERGAAGARQTISAKSFYNRSNMND